MDLKAAIFYAAIEEVRLSVGERLPRFERRRQRGPGRMPTAHYVEKLNGQARLKVRENEG